MSEFSKLWDTEVKSLARACVTEARWVNLLGKPKDYQFTEEENEYMNEVATTYNDPCGMYHISHMIGKIEHHLADCREAGAKLAASEVLHAMDNEDYFRNVFKSDDTSEEWKNRKKLMDGLRKLLRRR